MSDLRDRFVAAFGEHLAISIEAAIERHFPALKVPLERGSDPFRFALIWAVGLECLSNPAFRVEHGVVASWEFLRDWLRDADLLAGYDGTFDSAGQASGFFRDVLEPPTLDEWSAGVDATVGWLLATAPIAGQE
ncbi:MAG: hypothetical protein HY262_04335 [Chloroflexi bacterium]|nr:hypothetical protein [Chloroflexota bacterium]